MPDPRKYCKGTTIKGASCKLPPIEDSDFCRHHLPEQHVIRNFFEKHKEGIVGFLAGAMADPIAGDLYDFIKERLGMKHLVPPVVDAERRFPPWPPHVSPGGIVAGDYPPETLTQEQRQWLWEQFGHTGIAPTNYGGERYRFFR